MTDSRLAGKVCVITGAGSGIGAATADLFAEKQASGIVCADLDGDAATGVAARINARGGRATSFQIDVADPAGAEGLVEHALTEHGRLDVLHNNAGMGVAGAVHELSEEDWDRCIGVNLKGTFLVSRAALPVMLEQSSGAIVNTCSNHATVGSPRLAAYHASKGGIRALTRQMARDYAPDIRINCISPGLVDTPIARGGRAATPEEAESAWRMREESNRYFHRAAQPREIAFGVLFLVSDEASFLTGHDLVMSGGQGEVAF
jgi:NAD(P)-dependent dehydrogenase (short-subunit alcohol dehydrogenase family)